MYCASTEQEIPAAASRASITSIAPLRLGLAVADLAGPDVVRHHPVGRGRRRRRDPEHQHRQMRLQPLRRSPPPGRSRRRPASPPTAMNTVLKDMRAPGSLLRIACTAGHAIDQYARLVPLSRGGVRNREDAMAFEEFRVQIAMLMDEIAGNPRRRARAAGELREKLAEMQALGLPLPDDLVGLEEYLEEDLDRAALRRRAARAARGRLTPSARPAEPAARDVGRDQQPAPPPPRSTARPACRAATTPRAPPSAAARRPPPPRPPSPRACGRRRAPPPPARSASR